MTSYPLSVIKWLPLHNMIVIAPHSTRAACYIVLLTSNTKRGAFFLVRRHSETDSLESSLISVTSYSSITIRVLACIFPNFRQWKKDFTMIKFSRECRKFFISHVNCLNSGKNRKSKFHFICALKTNQISIGPYFLEIKEEKGSCWCKIKSTNFHRIRSVIYDLWFKFTSLIFFKRQRSHNYYWKLKIRIFISVPE